MSSYIGQIDSIVQPLKKVPYAVVEIESLGKVTFSMVTPVWEEDIPLKKGQFVVLSELVKYATGWRAHKARFMRPEDEKQQ